METQTQGFYILQTPLIPEFDDILTSIKEIAPDVRALAEKAAIVDKKITEQITAFHAVLKEEVEDGIITTFIGPKGIKDMVRMLESGELNPDQNVGLFTVPDGTRIGIMLTDKGRELAEEAGISPHVLIGYRIMNQLAAIIAPDGKDRPTIHSRKIDDDNVAMTLFEPLSGFFPASESEGLDITEEEE